MTEADRGSPGGGEQPGGWSAAEVATLAAVAEAFVPVGGARRAGLAVDALRGGTDPDDIERLRRALRLFETPFVNLVLAGRPTRFRVMSHDDRERYLLGWATSRLKDRGVAFQALKRLVCFLAYADPGTDGTNSRLDRIGYIPDLDVVTETPTTVRPELIAGSAADGGDSSTVTLEADVVIVGSGAGAGVVACALAEAGRSVIVLEAGPFVAEPAMPTGELAAFDRLYLNHDAPCAAGRAHRAGRGPRGRLTPEAPVAFGSRASPRIIRSSRTLRSPRRPPPHGAAPARGHGSRR